jgi:phenylpropionate dioxygenase-like ring-hydroxylating dioxygenase large terminal subunit
MDRSTEIALIERVLAHAETKTTDTAAAPSFEPARPYVDEAHHAREVSQLFRRIPLAIAHASTVAKPGDFLIHDASGVPLLVVRGDDGKVSAFMNVCRHRGTRLESAPCGNKRAFTCPYHAWSYARDGRLIGVPHERGFPGIARDTRGLQRVPAGEAAGLVWVVPERAAPDAGAMLDARAWLGSLEGDLDGFGIASSHVYDPRNYTRELNWKLAIDIFLETYHLKTAHRDSIYALFFDNLGLVDPVGAHLRNVFPKRSILELAHTDKSTWSLRHHANVLFHLFPNTLVLVQPDHTAVLHIWPQGAKKTLLTTYTLVPEPPENDKARAYWDANNRILYGATDEDFALGESIQRGVESGANETFVFGAYEHALAHFHSEVAARV